MQRGKDQQLALSITGRDSQLGLQRNMGQHNWQIMITGVNHEAAALFTYFWACQFPYKSSRLFQLFIPTAC